MRIVILGAGKIARGFLGHLLYLSNLPFVFVEKNKAVADLINERKEYTINILGDSSKNCVIRNVEAIWMEEEEAVLKELECASLVFTAVGGKNLTDLIPVLTKGIERRKKENGYLNIITCENWKQPATLLQKGIMERLSEEKKKELEGQIGVTEAVIMRSGIEAAKDLLKQDPLIVNMQDYWNFPVDASRLAGPLPEIMGLNLITEFTGFLERKFYTYNAANGTASYLGALLGYKYLADAAYDERILKILEGVYLETAKALSKKHNFPLQEQLEFTLTSKRKLQDRAIVDYIERNARDPLRKLGKEDRLVGSARMVMEYGIVPENLAVAIAAAIYYRSEEDEFANRLVQLRKEKGVDEVLQTVCEINPEEELGILIKEKIRLLQEWGWIREE